MADGDIFRAEEVGNGASDARYEVTTKGGKLAYSIAPPPGGGGGGGGGGGAVTVADGADAAFGAQADDPAATDGGAASFIALMKRLLGKFSLGQTAMAAALSVTIASDQPALAVALPDVFVSGTITAMNTVPAGAATAGSAVEISPAGRAQLSIQTVGVYTGALSLQATVDGTNWITLGGLVFYNVGSASQAGNIASAAQGIYTTSVTGFVKLRVTALAAVTGSVAVTLNCSANTDQVALDTAIPTGGNVVGGLFIAPASSSGGFTSNHNLVSVATTNPTLVKSTAGNIGMILLANTTTTWKFFKLYSKATAPTVGTDTPIMTIAIPPNGSREIIQPAGVRVGTGVGYGITGAAATADTTAVAAGDVIVNMSYV